jgi:UDP-N-acetylmuramate dehydrogenase
MNNYESVRSIVPDVEFQVPFSRLTTFRTGGPAAVLARPANLRELEGLFRFIDDNGLKSFVLGMGSNLLVSDKGFDGVAIRLQGELAGTNFEGTTATVGAGASLVKLSHTAMEKGLSGLEFAVAIPGTVGGAVFMNAGAHGSDISRVVREVRCLDSGNRERVYRGSEIEWGYRLGLVDSRCIFTTIFDFSPQTIDIIKKTMDNNLSVRKRSQPPVFRRGAFFAIRRTRRLTNSSFGPVCRSKGRRSGRFRHARQLHPQRGDATSSDIYRLIGRVRRAVLENSGIELQSEIRFLGDF